MSEQDLQPDAPSPPPPPPGPPVDTRELRAQAAADKARSKALRPWYKKKRWWLVGAVAALIVIAALSNGGGDDKKDSSSSTSDQTDESAGGSDDSGQDVYTVGQTAHTGDFDVTLNTVEDPFTPTNQFDSAGAGQRLVAVEITLTNTTDEARTFSSLIGAEVTDSQDRPWSVALKGLDRPQLDGEVQANGSRRGWLVFEVAEDAQGLKLRLEGDLTSTGSLFQL